MNNYEKFTILMSYQLFILDILNTKKKLYIFLIGNTYNLFLSTNNSHNAIFLNLYKITKAINVLLPSLINEINMFNSMSSHIAYLYRPSPTHSSINIKCCVHRPDSGQTEETAGHTAAWREVLHPGSGSCVSRLAAGVQPQ